MNLRYASTVGAIFVAGVVLGIVISSLSGWNGRPAAAHAQQAAPEVEPDLAALRADVERLKQVVPDQAHAMTDVAYQFTNLWFAGKAENWPLAEFYWKEAVSHMHWAVRIIPVRKDNAGQEVKLEDSVVARTCEYWPYRDARKELLETCRGPVGFIDSGSGPPILYFHGTGGGSELARIIEQSLIDQGFRLIIPDRPGFRDTSIECGRTTADAAWLARALLDHLKIRSVGVIGTSGGGPPAIAFASGCADRAAALVLQCAESHRWTSPQWLPNGMGWLLPLVRRRSTRRLVNLTSHLQARCLRLLPTTHRKAVTGQRYAGLANDPAMQELCDLIVQFKVRCVARPAGMDNDLDIFVDEHILERATVRCPTLIIHDRFDPVVPFAHAEWARANIPDATICEVQAGGHLIWVGRDAALMQRRRRDFFAKHLTG